MDLTTEVVCNDATNYITEHYSVESDQNGQIDEGNHNDQNYQSDRVIKMMIGDQNDNSEGLFSKVQNVRTKYANHIIISHLNIKSWVKNRRDKRITTKVQVRCVGVE